MLQEKKISKRIIIVDDDYDFLEELKDTLSLSGYDIVAVNDSTKVFDLAIKINPDLILLDLKMPVKSGFQVAEELKNFSATERIPIIAMSGFLKDNNLTTLNSLGIKKCIKKPFYPLDVIVEIERIFE